MNELPSKESGAPKALATPKLDSRFVDADGLLKALFTDESRPTMRWLRAQQRARTVPYYKFSRLVRFDINEVREALRKNLRVEARE